MAKLPCAFIVARLLRRVDCNLSALHARNLHFALDSGAAREREAIGPLAHPGPARKFKALPRLLAGGEGSSLSFQRTQSHSRPSRSHASAIWTSLYTAVPLCRSWICHCDSAIIIIIIIITITISSSSSILVPDMSAITDWSRQCLKYFPLITFSFKSVLHLLPYLLKTSHRRKRDIAYFFNFFLPFLGLLFFCGFTFLFLTNSCY